MAQPPPNPGPIRRSPVIAGPTAGGKSALAVAVAQELARRGLPAGEVVTADAFQIYRGMDIGTAKPTAAERAGVPHHLIDIVDPANPFTVHQWLEACERAIADIRARGAVPIVAGGTHLYLKSLLDGMFEGPAADPRLRAEFEALPAGELRTRLERVDPRAAGRIHPNDLRRTIRALEVHALTGRPISEHQAQWDRAARSDLVLVGLNWSSEALNRRVNARVRMMMEQGLLDEVRRLASVLGPQAREGLGYKQLLPVAAGRADLSDAVERIKIETRRFAKSQRTWLRRLATTPGSVWLTAEGEQPGEMAQLVVDACLADVDQGKIAQLDRTGA